MLPSIIEGRGPRLPIREVLGSDLDPETGYGQLGSSSHMLKLCQHYAEMWRHVRCQLERFVLIFVQ